MLLIRGRIGDLMLGRFEVSSGYDLQRFANVDDQRSWIVLHRLPLVLLGKDVKTRYRYAEKKRCGSVIGVPVHADSLSSLLVFLRQRVEECMAISFSLISVAWASFHLPQIPITHGRVMTLNIVPEIVIRQLECLGEELEQSAIHRVC